jgi:hypothetical protein
VLPIAFVEVPSQGRADHKLHDSIQEHVVRDAVGDAV